MSCGHEVEYANLYVKLVDDGFEESMISDVLSVVQSHYNCLGLSCNDVGRHIALSSSYPECFDKLDIAGYAPANATKTNMVSFLI